MHKKSYEVLRGIHLDWFLRRFFFCLQSIDLRSRRARTCFGHIMICLCFTLLVGDPFPKAQQIVVRRVLVKAGLRRAGPVEAMELNNNISIWLYCWALGSSGVLWFHSGVLLGFFCCSSGVLSWKITVGIAQNTLIPLMISYGFLGPFNSKSRKQIAGNWF